MEKKRITILRSSFTFRKLFGSRVQWILKRIPLYIAHLLNDFKAQFMDQKMWALTWNLICDQETPFVPSIFESEFCVLHIHKKIFPKKTLLWPDMWCVAWDAQNAKIHTIIKSFSSLKRCFTCHISLSFLFLKRNCITWHISCSITQCDGNCLKSSLCFPSILVFIHTQINVLIWFLRFIFWFSKSSFDGFDSIVIVFHTNTCQIVDWSIWMVVCLAIFNVQFRSSILFLIFDSELSHAGLWFSKWFWLSIKFNLVYKSKIMWCNHD